jgi:MYXO-CTERM domain-containing protein
VCATAAILMAGAALAPAAARADVTWPAEQILPSFSPPATTQDLIFIRGHATTWQAEGAGLGHATGHADGDGWLCQVGVDAPNQHMVYGPYDPSLPAGGNTARFRLKIDNNSADNNVQVIVDVRDSSTGTTLATREIRRQEFTVAGDWVSFPLAFSLPALGHAVELRVYWLGGAYVKVDSISVDRGSEDDMVLFASLKGVVNKTRPRIFSYEGDAFAEGEHAWLESLHLGWTDQPDPWALITKYRSELAGVVVWDPAQPDTMNLATTLAGGKKALVASPALLPRLMAAPYNLPVLEDLRGRFASKLAVYQYLHDTVWPTLGHRLLIGLSPDYHKASLREYAVALGAAVIWLDPRVAGESEMLDQFLDGLSPGAAFMGWWPEEGSGVERGSRHGIATVASDYATNLTMHGGMPRTVRVNPVAPKPALAKKIYVAFILSDGDNLQYVEHLMRKLWNDPGRGHVPMGWTVSPAMLDAMPGALDYYYSTASPDDALVSGPSGWGYGYPNMWRDATSLRAFVAKSDDYAQRAGLRVVTVWNTITGGIDAAAGAAFASHGPSFLGLTAQNTGGGLTIYGNTTPGFALSCNYCTGEQAMRDHINNAAAGWDGNAPRFVLIQAQPWTDVRPSSFRNVQDGLDARFVVVRPDVWFQLLRQANALRLEPVRPVASGTYRLVNEASGKCATRVGTAVEQRACADDDAQRWRVSDTSAGFARITSLTDEALAWNVDGGNGAHLTLGGAAHEWQPMWKQGDLYTVLVRHTDQCLDVPGGTADDAPLQQWPCNGASAQAFRFAAPVWPPPAPDAGPPPPADGGVGAEADAGPVANADASVGGGGNGAGGGCGCRVGPGAPDTKLAWILGAFAATLLVRRRRRR